jgi:hypothetical protein
MNMQCFLREVFYLTTYSTRAEFGYNVKKGTEYFVSL